MGKLIEIKLLVGANITKVNADCVLMKNVSEGLYGPEEALDKLSNGALAIRNTPLLSAPGVTDVLMNVPNVPSPIVVLVGVGSGSGIKYDAVGLICERGTAAALAANPLIRTVGTVTHAVGFGLELAMVFRAELFGFKRSFDVLPAHRVDEIQFVVSRSDSSRLEDVLQELASDKEGPVVRQDGKYFLRTGASSSLEVSFARSLKESRYVFVAMPFSQNFENVYDFGLRLPIEQHSLLPVRLDREHYSGSISQEIKSRIQKSSILIADITDDNPNVLYELGYADGVRVATIIVCQEGRRLPVDVHDINVLFYNRELLRDLKERVAARIAATLQPQ